MFVLGHRKPVGKKKGLYHSPDGESSSSRSKEKVIIALLDWEEMIPDCWEDVQRLSFEDEGNTMQKKNEYIILTLLGTIFLARIRNLHQKV